MTDRTHPDSGRTTGGIVEMLQDRVAELEAHLEAIGAGGVSGPLFQGFDAADMATAAAQGFRDGVASVTRPAAGQEPVARSAAERDELLQAAIDFIRTLTGMEPPPIEVAPPEVFAPFREFVDKVQAITNRYSVPQPAVPVERPCHVFTVRKSGALTEWEPTTMAFALPDGEHALYTITQPAVAAGWVMVPADPTLDMGWAYLDAARESEPFKTHSFNHDGYRAMLKAAPIPPAPSTEGD